MYPRNVNNGLRQSCPIISFDYENIESIDLILSGLEFVGFNMKIDCLSCRARCQFLRVRLRTQCSPTLVDFSVMYSHGHGYVIREEADLFQ